MTGAGHGQSPNFCQYAAGPCDQDLPTAKTHQLLFMYSNRPHEVASTIERAIDELKRQRGADFAWGWRDLRSTGRTVFCEICKGMRRTEVLVADITTLNLNVLYEIGFAVGLGIPVIPIRDATFADDHAEVDSLGLLSTLGYLNFQNSEQLIKNVLAALPMEPDPLPRQRINTEVPIYFVRPPWRTESLTEIEAVLEDNRLLRHRVYDPNESQILTLGESVREISMSVGVVVALSNPKRRGSRVSNARSAFVCGLAMAQQKVVVAFQSGSRKTPIDYRDVLLEHDGPSRIRPLIRPRLQQLYARRDDFRTTRAPAVENLLERLTGDLGHPAAENDRDGLSQYFIETAQYRQAQRANIQTVVGRKGTGKSALFYQLADWIGRTRRDRLLLDLKPDRTQFLQLMDYVEGNMPTGVRDHTLEAFWYYVLVTELSRALVERDEEAYKYNNAFSAQYEALEAAYRRLNPKSNPSFSMRLQSYIARALQTGQDSSPEEAGAALTSVLYSGEIRHLLNAFIDYARSLDLIWILADNLDKGIPVHGARDLDLALIHGLSNAISKIYGRLVEAGLEVRSLTFLRTDIYDQLSEREADKAKENPIRLDWDDTAVFQRLIAERIQASVNREEDFESLWSQMSDPLVHEEDSFQFAVSHTLMRPRDLISLLLKAIEIAVNRGHTRITERDFLDAVERYSEDQLQWLVAEIGDTRWDLRDAPLLFRGSAPRVAAADVEQLLGASTFTKKGYSTERIIELLVQFGFMGVRTSTSKRTRYSYDFRTDVRREMSVLTGDLSYEIHPAFRSALDIHDAGYKP